jgi:hypothetical protein
LFTVEVSAALLDFSSATLEVSVDILPSLCDLVELPLVYPVSTERF